MVVCSLQELPRQPLYRATFHQKDVWEGYTGSPADTLDVEIYQAWLEPASQQDLAHQQEHRHTLHEHAEDQSHPGHGHQHGDPQVIDHGDHTHEARSVVEQNAVDLEGQDDQERRRLSEVLIKVWTCCSTTDICLPQLCEGSNNLNNSSNLAYCYACNALLARKKAL